MHRRSSSCDNVRPMTPHRAVLGLVLIAMVLGIASEARAQYPMPRVRERPEAIDAAFRFFEAKAAPAPTPPKPGKKRR